MTLRSGLLVLAAATSFGCESAGEKGDRLVREGRYEEAEAVLREALDEEEGDDPDDVAALYALGWVCHRSGRPEEAADLFKRVLAVAPDDWRGYRGLGSVLLSLRQFDLARAQFEKALEKRPEAPEVLLSIGHLELARLHEEEAVAAYRRAVAAAPGQGEYLAALAEGLVRTDDLDGARGAIDEARNASWEDERGRAAVPAAEGRLLVRESAKAIDPEDCARTLPISLSILDRAGEALEEGRVLAPDDQRVLALDRLIRRRRELAHQECPPFQCQVASPAAEGPDGATDDVP